MKGSALGETVGLEERLLQPALRNAQGQLEATSWDQALALTATGLRQIIAEHGPEAVAFYVSGQMLTEDYYVANKMVKGWLGTANIDTNSRLCMSSAVAGHKRATAKVVTLFSQGVNQSSAGTDKVNSIIDCHLLSGRIGHPGRGPFSITGQPNAMGGREVGGLANTLAAHLELDKPHHREAVQSFWDSPYIPSEPGLKAVELFEAVHQGRIKALWIIGTNPVVSMPDADRVREALERCELLVVSDLFPNTDTARCADVLFPALGWGEKDGTVTNSERCISRQRAFLPAPGEARPDWWAICQIAKRLGFAGFDYDSAHQIFVEHARLSAWRNTPAELPRAFNIGGLAELDQAGYDDLQACQWPLPIAGQGTARLFADGRFYHENGRARLVPTPPRRPANLPDSDYPLILNSGRIRDQWHIMTRTGRAPRLASHLAEPFVAMHPYEAMLAGVQDGKLVRVSTRWGSVVVRLRCTPDQPRRNIFLPIHWNDQVASDARVGALINPVVDPVSGEPEFKHTPAQLSPFPVDWHGLIFSRTPLQLEGLTAPVYWVRIQGANYLRYEVAGRDVLESRAWNRWRLSAARCAPALTVAPASRKSLS